LSGVVVWFCGPFVLLGVGQWRLTVKVADGLAAYKKPISDLAIRKKNYTASLCGLGWFGRGLQPVVMCWQPLSWQSL